MLRQLLWSRLWLCLIYAASSLHSPLRAGTVVGTLHGCQLSASCSCNLHLDLDLHRAHDDLLPDLRSQCDSYGCLGRTSVNCKIGLRSRDLAQPAHACDCLSLCPSHLSRLLLPPCPGYCSRFSIPVSVRLITRSDLKPLAALPLPPEREREIERSLPDQRHK